MSNYVSGLHLQRCYQRINEEHEEMTCNRCFTNRDFSKNYLMILETLERKINIQEKNDFAEVSKN